MFGHGQDRFYASEQQILGDEHLHASSWNSLATKTLAIITLMIKIANI